MEFEPECFLRHIRACTNADLPGQRSRLRIGGAEVGWVLPEHAPCRALADRTAFDAFVDELRGRGSFRDRGELFDVRDDASQAAVATVDRAAIPLLGIRADGVHVNGLVRRPDGLHLWVGRRAADKKLDPGKLDHLVAGGVASGHGVLETLRKEAGEEASLPPVLAKAAQLAGVLNYEMERAEGLRRDRIYCFDLVLPDGFQPRPNDGEVVDFSLWPLADVATRVARTDDFKFNVNLVLIDLFLRHGVIDPRGRCGAAIAAALLTLRGHGAGRPSGAADS